jgi:hypothetical protein
MDIATVGNIRVRQTERPVSSCSKVTVSFQTEVLFEREMAQPPYVMWDVFHVVALIYLQTALYTGIMMHVLDGLGEIKWLKWNIKK